MLRASVFDECWLAGVDVLPFLLDAQLFNMGDASTTSTYNRSRVLLFNSAKTVAQFNATFHAAMVLKIVRYCRGIRVLIVSTVQGLDAMRSLHAKGVIQIERLSAAAAAAIAGVGSPEVFLQYAGARDAGCYAIVDTATGQKTFVVSTPALMMLIGTFTLRVSLDVVPYVKRALALLALTDADGVERSFELGDSAASLADTSDVKAIREAARYQAWHKMWTSLTAEERDLHAARFREARAASTPEERVRSAELRREAVAAMARIAETKPVV